MKKYTSVFNLLARQSFYKVLFLLGIIAVLEVGCFWFFGLDSVSLYKALRLSFAEVGMFFGLIALYYILLFPYREKHSKVSLTLLRLRVSPKAIAWIQSLYNVLILLLFFMVHALILLGLSFWYSLVHGSNDPMTLFVTAYQHGMLYLVLPLQNWMPGLLRLALIILFGCCWAWDIPFFNKQGSTVTRFPIEVHFFISMYIQDREKDGIFYLIMFAAIGCVLVVATLIKIFRKRRDDDG